MAGRQFEDHQPLPEKEEEIKIIIGEGEISKQYFECLTSTKKRWDITSDGRMAYSFHGDAFNEVKKMYLACIKKGVKVRIITEITKENLAYCKEALPYFSEMRHIDKITSTTLVSDCCYLQTHELFYKKYVPNQALFSNMKPFVNQQQLLFDAMWEKATPAFKRIMEIEKRADYTETIHDPHEIMELYTSLIKSSTKEIMLIVPSSHICKLMIEVTQLLNLLYNVAHVSDTHVKILTPLNESLQEMIKCTSQGGSKNFDEHIQIRDIQSMPSLRKEEYGSSEPSYWDMKSAMILISDRTDSLAVQITEDQDPDRKNENNGSLYEFIESATYSNKESTVISYISLFEGLWQQVELYKKVIESENAGNEFISIAAHELRNPIQPILGLAEVVRDKSMDSEQKQMLDIITRNARKLKSLSDNILEVSRAEMNTLKLSIEKIDIAQFILDNLQEYQNYINNIGKKVNIEFENNFGPEGYTIYADKDRLNQVISNLVNNAIKFTDDGIIKINADAVINKKDDGTDSRTLMISIKDNGKGIDPNIMHKLFTKFTTSGSDKGTGIGLYLSKKIIEAHGGTIRAYNNEGEKGATFSFSLQ
jgi:two-component system sensor histidine kinase VicK